MEQEQYEWSAYQRIHVELKEFVQNPNSSILLNGVKGLPLYTDALSIAAGILQTTVDKLSLHPDFLLVDIPKDRKHLGVDESEQIIHKARLKQTRAMYTVIVIHHLEMMTPQAQNKLLKLIEDNQKVCIIGISYGTGVLPTIRSRMRYIQYSPMTRDEFSAYALQKGMDKEQGDILYFLHEGCPLELNDSEALLDIFLQVKKAILTDQWINLFCILHLTKEKDSESFFNIYPEKVASIFRFIGDLLLSTISIPLSLEQERRLTVVRKHLELCTCEHYTKDFFFQAIAELQ